MGFVRSSNLGNKGEQLFIGLCVQADLEATKEDDKLKQKEHDVKFQIGKKTYTCEVKYDYMAVKTGNICIEHHNAKKDEPSGIMATKATIWCQIILDGENPTVWIANTAELKKFIENNEPTKKIIAGGDKNANLYLYKLESILPVVFKRLDNLDKAGILKVLKEMVK